MLKLAHRGYSQKYPENTMLAFKKAYEEGFDGVETDVHMTKDGRLVLIHDEKINRTSNGKGYVKDMTLKELRQYNYSYHFQYDCSIPTLEELLEFCKDKDFKINIELKTDVIHYCGLEEAVYNLVQKYNIQNQVYYSSFYLPSVLIMQQFDPCIYVGYLMENKYNQKTKELLDHHIKAYHPRYNYLNRKRIEFLKQHQKMIAAWTVPHFKEYKRLESLGVDIIISNEYFK